MSARNKASPWVWFSLAALVGVFALFIFYLDQKIVKSARNSAAPQPQQQTSVEPIIDFYQVLPNREVEVEVPEANIMQAPGGVETLQTGTRRFMLQAGSFRKPQDADRRKAELALLGLEAKIRSAQVNGESFHRVELGPFVDDGFFSKVKSRLIKNGIDYIPKSVN